MENTLLFHTPHRGLYKILIMSNHNVRVCLPTITVVSSLPPGYHHVAIFDIKDCFKRQWDRNEHYYHWYEKKVVAAKDRVLLK